MKYFLIIYAVAVLTFVGTCDVVYSQSINRTEQKIDIQERKRPKAEKGASRRKPRINQRQLMATQLEGRLIKGINRTVENMRNIIAGLPRKSPKRLQLMEKMLNLNIENAAYVTSREQKTYDEEWNAWDANGRRGPEPRPRNGESNKLWARIVKLSDQILKDFPKGPNSDQINYSNALALQFLKRDKAAAKSFSTLIQKYPNSKVAGDAHFSLGDYFFDKTDFRNAMNNYRSALKYKRSSRYGWALFKLGWSHYNLGDYRKALTYWKQTVSYSKINRNKAQSLKDEALRDMVYAFAELGSVEPAIAYFNANGGREYLGKFLKLLAVTLVDQGKFARGISAYKRLQSAAPFADEAPEAQSEIISLNYELGQVGRVWKELEVFPVKYGPKSAWARRKDKKLNLETQKMIRDQMLYYSKLTHKKAQERKSKTLMAQARVGYQLYLKSYPQSRQAVEVKYNLADIEYFRKRYTQAGRLYLEIGLLGKKRALVVDENGKPTKNIHADAAKFMLDAYYKAYEPRLKRLLKVKPDLKKPKRPIPRQAQDFIKACGTYVKWYPGDRKVRKQCDVYTADIFYRSNDRKNALKFLWNVAKKYPKEKEGRAAVDNIIPLYKNDKRGLNLAVARLLKIPEYAKGETGKKLRGLQLGVQEESLAAESNQVKKGDGFIALAKKNPNSPNAYKYYYNAAVAYIKGGQVPKAVGAYAVVANKYAKTPQAKESLLQIAKISDKRLSFGQAVRYYSQYVTRYPKSKEAPGASQRMCDLTIALSPERALGTCKRLGAYSKDAYVESLEDLITSLYLLKNYSRMNSVINEYLKTPGLSANQKIAANYKRYVAAGRRSSGARKFKNAIMADYRAAGGTVSGESLRYAAEMVFDEVNPVMAKYGKIKLTGGTVEKLQASIDRKSVALKEVEENFARVTNTKDAYWGSAALFQVGLAYEQLGLMLANPPGITGAKKADVIKQLAPISNQAYQKAKQFFENGMASARQFGVYNDYTPKLASAIARRSGSKVTFDDWILTPDFIGSEVSRRVSSRVQ